MRNVEKDQLKKVPFCLWLIKNYKNSHVLAVVISCFSGEQTLRLVQCYPLREFKTVGKDIGVADDTGSREEM